ncbi:MAG: DNA cytosine methyltransferase [Roseinatronobacter sp.]
MFTHIDCFSGVGGVATGFHAAGFTTLLAIEKVQSCAETYAFNHPNVSLIQGDIREVSDDKVLSLCAGSVDVVTAGMPCETFSTAGSSSRSFYDHRQTLFEEAIRIADAVSAKFILFENVPGFANKKVSKGAEKLVIDLLRECLNDRGYTNQLEVVLNSRDFGVPQSRQRLFVLATRDNISLSAPESTDFRTTVGEAFANLPLVDTTGPHSSSKFLKVTNEYLNLMADSDFWRLPAYEGCSYQKSPKHRIGTIKRFELIKTGEGLKSLFDRLSESEIAHLQEERILPKRWYIQRNRRLNLNDVSPTVTSHCLDELLHPTLNRSITVREAARLQSFPDAYQFVGGPEICPHIYETQDKYEQIGDAVPPLMAYNWAIKLRGLLNAGRSSETRDNIKVCSTV